MKQLVFRINICVEMVNNDNQENNNKMIIPFSRWQHCCSELCIGVWSVVRLRLNVIVFLRFASLSTLDFV